MTSVQAFASHPWVNQFGWTLIHFIWQGALIAALYAMGRKVPGNAGTPQIRYLTACAALAALVVAPVITFGILAGSASAPANPYVGKIPVVSIPTDALNATHTSLAASVGPDWRDQMIPWLVMIWCSGALVFWARLVGGWAIAARMRSNLVRPAPAEWQVQFERLRARVQVSRPVRLLVSALVQVPTVIGWLRPVVLVPVGALAGLPAEHVEALLAHELAHIRRHDYLVNILQSLAEALLFYHPAVWWISSHIRDERELCCDDVAVSVSGDVFIYAQALAGLESNRSAHYSPVLAANGGSLRERIGRLLNQPASRITHHQPAPGIVLATVLVLAATYALFGQQPVARPTFEAASIKPNNLGGGHMHMHNSPGRLTAQMTTKDLIEQAYGLKQFQVSGGPAWLGNDNYDFSATTPTPVDLPNKVLQPYLQSLLADRFHLRFHRETKEFPVYLLMLAKNGPKLISHSGEGGEGTNSHGDRVKENMTGTNLSMAGLAAFLASRLDRPVIDHTGLTGKYDVALEWSPDQTGDLPGPSVFTALQEQLGLRLESAKGPVEILIVDSVEKPSEN